MKNNILILLLLLSYSYVHSQSPRSEILFDGQWKFQKGNPPNAENPSYNDATWREIDLPHDWSIEALPNQKPGEVVGPFSKNSPGRTATGNTMGGTGWYRKTFTPSKPYGKTIINFDGVYMNCEVYVNGKLAQNQPYGYTSFQVDITDFLEKAGKKNVIAVKVQNEGQNSRWYSGSGIYRHVWLIQKNAINIAHDGVFISTDNISSKEAVINTTVNIKNEQTEKSNIKLRFDILNPEGKVVKSETDSIGDIDPGSFGYVKKLTIPNPQPWSLNDPNLYTAEITLMLDNETSDQTTTTFGIRTIHFDAETGFTLNGESVLLKGGCLHHDNGFLGSKTLDRAEERKVELMKAYGFNAIRTAHNPPSKQFLDACDRNGVLVINEAFDVWVRSKKPEDYHLYFEEWWQRDLTSLILRDRNHPSVIMWSIGNEINERAEPLGYEITQQLADETRRLDPTRPVTEAICSFYDHPGQSWSTTAPTFAHQDVGSYNYMHVQYEEDHQNHPQRIMVGTESYAGQAYSYWKKVEDYPYVIGDFVWTAMDYLGEAGLGNSRLDNDPDRGFLRSWPWFNAFCGDIDLTGNKKPQLLYRDVIWKNSDLEVLVHSPIPEGRTERVSQWGWPNELPSWSWEGHEGKELEVRVFSRHQTVRLERNGKIIGEKPVHDSTELVASFKVPYEPGILRAVALQNGIEVASKELMTTGVPARVRLIADRNKITNNRNDLSYVQVEVTDVNGNLIPNASVPLTFKVSGVGEIAGSGNANPSDAESFNSPTCMTFHGRALVILRPSMETKEGTIELTVESEGLETGIVHVEVGD